MTKRPAKTIRPWLPRAGAVLSLLATVAFIAGGSSAARQFISQRATFAKLPLSSRAQWDAANLNVRFLAWARARIAMDDYMDTSYWLAYRPNREPANLRFWTLYQMVPFREAVTASRADWVILYGETPAATRLNRAGWRVERYAPGFAIAERER